MSNFGYRFSRNGSHVSMLFADPGNEILTTFINFDAKFFVVKDGRIEDLRRVLDGEIEELRGSGDISDWVVGPSMTTIHDLYDDEPDYEAGMPVSVPTARLEELMLLWRREYEFAKRDRPYSDKTASQDSRSKKKSWFLRR